MEIMGEVVVVYSEQPEIGCTSTESYDSTTWFFPLSRKGLWYCVNPQQSQSIIETYEYSANTIPISLALISNWKYQEFLWQNQAQKHAMEKLIKP